MKVAILGSNGNVGSYLVQSLSWHHTILPVTRDTVNLTDHSAVYNWLQEHRPDAVINCATATKNFQVTDFIYDDIRNNLNIFLSFYNNSDLFGKFINVGSGAEFDRTNSIDLYHEEYIFAVNPRDSYGYSKNVISRLVLEKPNFYTLRLFGGFSSNDPDFRYFKKIISGQDIELIDRQVDYISLKDFSTIVQYYLNNDELYKDINCVYYEKYLLSELYEMFKIAHKLKSKLNIVSIDKNYTGDGAKLQSLNLKLDGLFNGIKDYK